MSSEQVLDAEILVRQCRHMSQPPMRALLRCRGRQRNRLERADGCCLSRLRDDRVRVSEVVGGRPAHVIVVPNKHYENVYSIPEASLAAVYGTAKLVSGVIRAVYACEGTSMRRHNEPGGGQDVWHFHVHLFPRHVDDRLYERNAATRRTSAEERAPFARRLREALASAEVGH